MTENQLQALTDLRDGEWKFGNQIRGRNSLPSLHNLKLVNKNWGKRGMMQWQITPEGLKLLKELTPELFKGSEAETFAADWLQKHAGEEISE